MDIKIETIENQARTYMYDLMNEAKEHGFKNDDSWKLVLANETDKNRIKRDFRPAVANKVAPVTLLQLFQTIKINLKQNLSKEEQELNLKDILADELQYIVAFNPKRVRS